MSLIEITQAAMRTAKAIPGADITVHESGSGRNFRVEIKLNGEQYFESGTPQYLLGFLRGFTARGTQS